MTYVRPHTPILVVSGSFVREDHQQLLLSFFARQGITDEQIKVGPFGSYTADVLVPIDDGSLELCSGHSSLDRWHCSVLHTRQSDVAVGLLPISRVLANWKESAYWTLGIQKVARIIGQAGERPPKLRLVTSYDIEGIKVFCARCKAAPFVSIDIETSGSLINTVGFAISPQEAIAIRVDEGYWSRQELFAIWQMIDDVLRSPVPKVLQNFIFETLIFASYGLTMTNVVWDTMLAMKFLNPEMEKGLANVGRVYTPFPYWKDDRGDWWNIQDWQSHLTYNCRDTIGTAWAYLEQRRDASERGVLPALQRYVLDFLPLVHEMSVTGLGVDVQSLGILRERAGRAVQEYTEFIERVSPGLNVNSPLQVKKALKARGLKIPTKAGKETLDKKSMAKLRKKYPKDDLLPALVALGKESKKLESLEHMKFQGERMTYSMDACHDELGTWVARSDPWGNGFDLTETYYPTRQMFQAQDGCVLVEVKLDNPITRYMAFDSADAKLMGVLDVGCEGLGRTLEAVTAGFIFGKDPDGIPEQGRESKLASRAIREIPYGIGPRQFAELCAYELDVVIDEREAKRIISTFHGHFPGVMRRQRRIQDEIRRSKKIATPLGRERYFYDRIGDSLFREAYAYAPRATASDFTTALMRFLWEHADFARVLLKMPDAVLLEVEAGRQYEIAEMARDYEAWHPKVRLAGGVLTIPVEANWGSHWRPMEKM